MSVQRLMESVRNTSIQSMLARHEFKVTEEQEREVLAMLVPAADKIPKEGRLSTMPNFMPRGNQYNKTECEAFQEPGWLLSYRRTDAALPVFRELFATHASREVRLASGHFLLAYPGTAAEVAEGAVERAKDLVGWFRLWVGAQIALSPAEAYVAVADRIATASGNVKPLLDAAMDAGWHAAISDPRWGDLAMMTLEHDRRHHSAMRVLASTKDRRGIAPLLEETRHPDLGTVMQALEQLVHLLDEAELVEAVTPIVEQVESVSPFELFFGDHQMKSGFELLARVTEQRTKKPAKRNPRGRSKGRAKD